MADRIQHGDGLLANVQEVDAEFLKKRRLVLEVLLAGRARDAA